MRLHVLPPHLHIRVTFQQLAQLLEVDDVLHRLPGGQAPILAYPAVHPLGHRIDDELRVGANAEFADAVLVGQPNGFGGGLDFAAVVGGASADRFGGVATIIENMACEIDTEVKAAQHLQRVPLCKVDAQTGDGVLLAVVLA